MKALVSISLCLTLFVCAAQAAGSRTDISEVSLPPDATFFVRPVADTTGSSFRGMGARNIPLLLEKAIKAELRGKDMLSASEDGTYSLKTSLLQFRSDHLDNSGNVGSASPRLYAVTRVNSPQGKELGHIQTRVPYGKGGSREELLRLAAEDILSQLRLAMGMAR